MRLFSTVVLLATVSITAAACVPGKQRNRNAPTGRGSFTTTMKMPETDTKTVLAQRYGMSTTQPAAQAQPTAVAQPAAAGATLPPQLVDKKVAVHLTQGAPSLASGPRKDVVKGVIRKMDGDFLVIEADGGGTLYLPKNSVLAIEELP